MVDNFGAKYAREEHVKYLEHTIIQSGYRLKSEWTEKKYIGITLDWDYAQREAYLPMPGYNEKGLKRFGHEAPAKRQDSPHEHAPIKYGATTQYATDNNTLKPLDKQDTK